MAVIGETRKSIKRFSSTVGIRSRQQDLFGEEEISLWTSLVFSWRKSARGGRWISNWRRYVGLDGRKTGVVRCGVEAKTDSRLSCLINSLFFFTWEKSHIPFTELEDEYNDTQSSRG